MSGKSLYPLAERMQIGLEFLLHLHEHGPSTAQDYVRTHDVEYNKLISAILLLKTQSAIVHANDNYYCKTWTLNPEKDFAELQSALTSGNLEPFPEKASGRKPLTKEERCQKFWDAFIRGKPIRNLNELG